MQHFKQTTCVLILAAFAGGCAHSDPWTQRDTNMQILTTLVILGDGLSSIKIRETENVHEAGSIAHRFIGRQPTKQDLLIYHTSLSVLSFGVARMLPAKLRPWWQTIEMILHGSAIINNCDLNLC